MIQHTQYIYFYLLILLVPQRVHEVENMYSNLSYW